MGPWPGSWSGFWLPIRPVFSAFDAQPSFMPLITLCVRALTTEEMETQRGYAACPKPGDFVSLNLTSSNSKMQTASPGGSGREWQSPRCPGRLAPSPCCSSPRQERWRVGRGRGTESGAGPLTLFPYCMTWLVLVWDFTSWYCLWRVSLVKSSCESENSEVLQPSEPEGETSAQQPAPEGLTTSESSIQLTLYQSPR